MLALRVRPDVRLAVAAGVALGPSGGFQVDAWMRTSAPDMYAAGDTVEYVHAVTGRPMLVPLAGRVAGEHAATDGGPALAPVLGTSIVRAFDVVAGGTGLIVAAAEVAELSARSLCRTGQRAHVASRLLRGLGFGDALTPTGGMLHLEACERAGACVPATVPLQRAGR